MLDERLTQPRSTPISRRECLENIDALLEEAQNESAPDERKLQIHSELQAWESELRHAEAWNWSIIAAAQQRRQTQRKHIIQK